MRTALTQSRQDERPRTTLQVFFFWFGGIVVGLLLGTATAAVAYFLSRISYLILLGLAFVISHAVSNAYIVPMLHKRTVKALVNRVSMYALYFGWSIVVISLVLILQEFFQGRFWYSVLLWTFFVLVIVAVLLWFFVWVLKSTTLRHRTPLKNKGIFPSRLFIAEARPEKSFEDRFIFPPGCNCTWDDVVRVRPHFAKPRESTAQNHIICLDGTWNDAESETNVHRLFKLLSDHCYNGEPQIARYYTGVGVNENQGLAVKVHGEEVTKDLLQSVTGLGERSIRYLAYFDLVTTYQPGDKIFIFGFSRGASSARILANLISKYGIPERVQAQFRRAPVHKGEAIGPDRLMDLAVLGDQKRDVEIQMMGLWDTVAAFGLPSNKFEPFRKLSIPDNVRKVYHLVAIDERRWEFDATLIEHDARNDRIEEIWFAGAHTNVGGGSGDNKLSDIALRFMVNRALEHGICFKPEWACKLEDDASGPEWPLWSVWPKWFTRRIRVEGGEPKALPRIHKSVFKRQASGIVYHPKNLEEMKVEKKYTPEERD